MTGHDPLCMWNGTSITFDGNPLGCTCEYAAQVRADERERFLDSLDVLDT